jgi:cell division protein FtsN
MLRNHASVNIGNVSRFVNGLVATAMVTMIGASYFAALGRIVIA